MKLQLGFVLMRPPVCTSDEEKAFLKLINQYKLIVGLGLFIFAMTMPFVLDHSLSLWVLIPNLAAMAFGIFSVWCGTYCYFENRYKLYKLRKGHGYEIVT